MRMWTGIQEDWLDHSGSIMARRKFGEGDWFAVPLRDGGFGTGIIARAKRSLLVGYFFGPKQDTVPRLSDFDAVTPFDAVLTARFGYPGLKQGEWPLLGRRDSWDATEWPMPVFARHEVLTGRSFHVIYDEMDPNRLLAEEQVPPGVAEQAPSNALFGYGALEKRLTRLLAVK
jgi:hypothetical protein